MITCLFAEATNEFAGQWFYVAIAAIGGALGLAGIISFFATRREVDEIKEKLKEQDEIAEKTAAEIGESYRRLDRSDEARISGIHNRLNPLEITVANLQGQMTSFTTSFDKFTRIIEATSRAREDQTAAFIQALNTFAQVCADREKKS